MNTQLKGFLFGVLLMGVLGAGLVGGALADRLFVVKPFDYVAERLLPGDQADRVESRTSVTQRVLTEESVVIDVAEKASPSVVTVSVTRQERQMAPFFMDPFGFFGQNFYQPGATEEVKRDIGSGFVIDEKQGLVVTNKHVVSDNEATYRVISKDNQEYEVTRIYRDPANDLAILKIDAQLPAMELGDSDTIKVGQFVIAIGTALGEFRHTVTTGVVSGLGRGIDAGDGFGGYVERLDNVIQTDAAINPGNSGGPLLNSAGQVVGVSVAVAQGGQNIGFALPINVIKDSLENFNQTGQFDRPFLGVRYRMITKEAALLNEVPEGAYIVEVVANSPAAEAGITNGDIITKLNGKSIKDTEGGLAAVINTLKVGDQVEAEFYRDGKSQTVTVTMKAGDS
jgi:S1-C subfamily serine protease